MYCRKTEALFDICVIDTDAQSHAHRSVNTVLATVAREKKRKYTQAAQTRHASFSPFVLSVDGLMACDLTLCCNGSVEHLPLSGGNPMGMG